MSTTAFDKKRLGRMHEVLGVHVAGGDVPGLVALVSRHGETHVEVIGKRTLGGDPIRRDTIFRVASMTKPISAAAAMILVEECKLRLDEPVDRLLPELANRRVLKRLDGPLDDTVPARRPISVRDLLTLRMGLGFVFGPEGAYPIMTAAREQGILRGPPHPQSAPGPDAWIRGLGTLPLMRQPGEAWMYDVGLEVLGVLIARAAGQPFEVFLRERLLEPLGMKDTGFSVPARDIGRLSGCYQGNAATGKLEVYDDVDGEWSRPPALPSSAAGLVSTADDYLAFCKMLLARGRHGSERVLSRASVELMTTDQLTAEQRAGGGIILGENSGWGFGMSVDLRRDSLGTAPGRFGWNGGLGTSGYADPAADLVGILMTSRTMSSPVPPGVFLDFWTSAYQALAD
jgi:CubicO group peptidase (beta-lactamase class C family)